MGHCPFALYQCLLDDLAPLLAGATEERQAVGRTFRAPIGASDRAIAACSLATSFYKKFQDVSLETADRRAIDLFRSVNNGVKRGRPVAEDLMDEYLLGEFRRKMLLFTESEVLDHLNPIDLYKFGRTGPGSSVGARGCDFYTKMFSGPLTCTTAGLYRCYVAGLRGDPRALRAEFARTKTYPAFEVVKGSKMSCVPKNATISRTICSEPVLNMFFQLGLAAVLEKGLKRHFGLDLSSQQERNRLLVWSGSLVGDYASIDLSSASDMISPAVLEWCLPKSLSAWLALLRCGSCDVNGEDVELNMISTMGNGFTFPLMTAIFACAVASAYTLHDIDLIRDGDHMAVNYGVFGDDIVCETKVFSSLCRLLNLLGFTVNAEKSFDNGDFRESCGHDYNRGVNVRGVYVESLRTPQATYTVINRLIEWSSYHSISIPRTVRLLRRWVEFLPVPRWEQYDAGIRVPYQVLKGSHLFRLDRNRSPVYFRWGTRSPVLQVGADGLIRVPEGFKKRSANHAGLLIAFLHGSLRHMQISTRPKGDKVLYVKKRKVGPDWDYRSEGGMTSDPRWEQRWESAVVGYFFDV